MLKEGRLHEGSTIITISNYNLLIYFVEDIS